MNYELKCVEENHRLFGVPIREEPDDKIGEKELKLRQRLVREESEELIEALENSSIVKLADAIVDIMVVLAGSCIQLGSRPDAEAMREGLAMLVLDARDLVCRAINNRDYEGVKRHAAQLQVILYGAASVYGIPYLEVFNEVHRTNMAKVGPDGKPIFDAGGKFLKPKGWVPPDIKGILNAAGLFTDKEETE